MSAKVIHCGYCKSDKDNGTNKMHIDDLKCTVLK